MKHRLTILLAFATIMLNADFSSAQLVPLILDQTIELPCSSDCWDVMPHPNGYYVWAQAVTSLDTNHTTLFVGQTDSTEYDSLFLALGNPRLMRIFWLAGFVPAATIENRISGATYARSISLVDGATITDSLVWRDMSESGYYYYWSRTGHTVIAIYPFPPPPQISESVSLVEIHRYYYNGGHSGYYSETTDYPGLYVFNALLGSPSPTQVVGRVNYCDMTILNNSLIIGKSGQGSGDILTWVGHTHWEKTDLTFASCFTDTVFLDGLTLDSVTHASRVACTTNSATGISYMFVWASDAYSIISSRLPLIYRSVAPPNIQYPMAVDLVTQNTCEEFIGYQSDHHAFSIYDAVTGTCYGWTDTLSVTSTPRIISRYDSTFRQLAVRNGNQIKLYRFGEYLSVDEHPVSIPAKWKLTAYPNPFNAATNISYDLPQAGRVSLSVFNLQGQKVATLVDGIQSAGAYSIPFDGSTLASGVYLYRLQTEGFVQTQKMVLLK